MSSILELITGNITDELTISTLCAYMIFILILEVLSSMAASILKVGKKI